MKQFAPSRKFFQIFNIVASFSLCCAATFFALARLSFPLTGIDDANIYFVYARNLANGYGFVYNIGGERIEGFTSLLWTVMSALGFKLSSSPEILLLIINIILVSLGIVYALNYLQASHRDGETWQARLFWSVLFLIFLFTSPRYVVWNTITLMENALWSTLLLVTTVFVIQDLPSPRSINLVFLPLSILLLLARPESLLWVLVFLCVLFLRLVFDGGIARAVKVLAPSLAGVLLAMTLFTLFRLQYFGYPLPNTYYAKVSPSLTYNVGQGALYLLRYFISDPIATVGVLAIFLACIYSIRKVPPGSGEFYLPFLAATGLLVPLLTGGDHFGSFRFYQNVFPITLLCLIYFARVLVEIARSQRKMEAPSKVRTYLFPSLAVFLLLGFGISLSQSWASFPPEIRGEFEIARYQRINGAFLQDLFASLPRLPSVGVIAAGGIKVAYRGEIVDLVGLNNTVMAHNHGNRLGYKGHAAFEKDTFFKLQPQILLPFLANDKWQYSETELHNRWENTLAFKGLFDEPRFMDLYSYAKVCRASDSTCKMAVVGWFRKDFLESLKANTDYQVDQYDYSP